MRTCRYCHKNISNIGKHIKKPNICRTKHRLRKKELFLNKKELILNRKSDVIETILNHQIFGSDNELLFGEICIVFEDSSKINLLNKFSTDKIYECSNELNCPVCLKEKIPREDYVIINNCGHHICKTCLETIEQLQSHLCPVCRCEI